MEFLGSIVVTVVLVLFCFVFLRRNTFKSNALGIKGA